MALSHRTFATSLRVVASDPGRLYEPTVRDLLRQAADRIEDLRDTIEHYEQMRLFRLSGMGSPQ